MTEPPCVCPKDSAGNRVGTDPRCFDHATWDRHPSTYTVVLAKPKTRRLAAPLVSLVMLGISLVSAAPAAPAAAAPAADNYVKICHSTLSVPLSTGKLWVRSDREPQRTVPKGLCTTVWDGNNSAEVYVSYPGWRARSNAGGNPWGPCHAGYSWSNPGISPAGFSYRGYWNSLCG